MPTRTCARCGETKPLTSKYFYKVNHPKDGHHYSCKECMRAYQNDYNKNNSREVTKLRVGVNQIRQNILSKYEKGQVVNLRYRSPTGKITERKKAEIIKFYPHHVLCIVDRCRECFTYVDLAELTRHKKGDK